MPVIRGWFSPIWENQQSVRRRLTNYNEGQVNIDRRRLKATELTLMQTWIRKIQHCGLISSLFLQIVSNWFNHSTYDKSCGSVWCLISTTFCLLRVVRKSNDSAWQYFVINEVKSWKFVTCLCHNLLDTTPYYSTYVKDIFVLKKENMANLLSPWQKTWNLCFFNPLIFSHSFVSHIPNAMTHFTKG